MFQINTGTNQQWEVDYRSPDAVTLNSEPFAWNISDLGGGRYHILHEGRSFNAEVIEADYATKNIVLKLNGQRVELQAKDRFDLLLERLGMANAATTKVNELKAPMPGLIVDIRVQPGPAGRLAAISNGDASPGSCGTSSRSSGRSSSCPSRAVSR